MARFITAEAHRAFDRPGLAAAEMHKRMLKANYTPFTLAVDKIPSDKAKLTDDLAARLRKPSRKP